MAMGRSTWWTLVSWRITGQGKKVKMPNSKLYFVEEGGLIKLLIDSAGQKVNSVAGEIALPESVTVTQIQEANSLISFWIESPRVADGAVKFAGIIPGGYQGTGGQILALQINPQGLSLRTKTQGESLRVSNAQVLLHDGLGTSVAVETPGFNFTPSDSVGLVDEVPPEPFTPLLAQEPSVFSGQQFVAFQTQDKQSGINYYEVKEGWGKWQKAESPHELTSWGAKLRVLVKAVDLAGNERVATVFSPGFTYLSYFIGGIILIVLCVLGWKKFFRRSSLSR